jgi:hypothetical protein
MTNVTFVVDPFTSPKCQRYSTPLASTIDTRASMAPVKEGEEKMDLSYWGRDESDVGEATGPRGPSERERASQTGARQPRVHGESQFNHSASRTPGQIRLNPAKSGLKFKNNSTTTHLRPTFRIPRQAAWTRGAGGSVFRAKAKLPNEPISDFKLLFAQQPLTTVCALWSAKSEPISKIKTQRLVRKLRVKPHSEFIGTVLKSYHYQLQVIFEPNRRFITYL